MFALGEEAVHSWDLASLLEEDEGGTWEHCAGTVSLPFHSRPDGARVHATCLGGGGGGDRERGGEGKREKHPRRGRKREMWGHRERGGQKRERERGKRVRASGQRKKRKRKRKRGEFQDKRERERERSRGEGVCVYGVRGGGVSRGAHAETFCAPMVIDREMRDLWSCARSDSLCTHVHGRGSPNNTTMVQCSVEGADRSRAVAAD